MASTHVLGHTPGSAVSYPSRRASKVKNGMKGSLGLSHALPMAILTWIHHAYFRVLHFFLTHFVPMARCCRAGKLEGHRPRTFKPGSFFCLELFHSQTAKMLSHRRKIHEPALCLSVMVASKVPSSLSILGVLL